MAPSRRKGASKAAAAAAARRQWKVGDLVLAKVKGFPAWPATVSEPEKWGYKADVKKVLVYFFGTQQIAFCNPADVEAFTQEKKESLLIKRHGKGADFVRAVHEIIESYEKLKKQEQTNTGNSTDEQCLTSENNAAETFAKGISKDEAPTTFQSSCRKQRFVQVQNDSNDKTEDAAATIGKGGLPSKETLSKEISCALIVTEMPVETTYSTRQKFGGAQFNRSVTRRRSPSTCRPGISSGAETNKLQDFMIPSINSPKGVEHVAGSVLQDGLLRRNKRITKSPDTENVDIDSSDLVSNGSIGGNDSEILTADSDALSFNEGSTVESACKIALPDSAADMCLQDIELSQRLDFRANAIIHKKKRKSSRKRHGNDSGEFTVKSDEKMALEADAVKMEHKLPIDNERCTERSIKEDGDEHLPLVKRARVRMGRTTFCGYEPDASQDTKEKPPEGSNALLNHVHGSSDMEVDGSTHQNSLIAKGVTDNSSPPYKYPAVKPHPWEVKKNHQFSTSLDGEAALPPYKRLHRALEAMSANAAEDNLLSPEVASPIKHENHGSYSSPLDDISKLVMGGQPSNEFLVEKADKHLTNSASEEGGTEFSARSDLIITGTRISPVEMVACATDDDLKTKSCKDVLGSMECSDGKLVLKSSLKDLADHVVILHSPKSPNLCESVDCGNRNNESQGMVILPEDCCDTGTSGLVREANSDSETSGKTTIDHSIQNSTAMNMGSADEKFGTTKLDEHLVLGSNKKVVIVEELEAMGTTVEKSCATLSPTPVELMIASHDEENSHPSDSVSDDHSGDKAVSVTRPSSLTDGLDSFVCATPQTSTCNVSVLDNNSAQINGSCSPTVHSQSDVVKTAAKWTSKEANVALASFEALLGTLTRTKESIGRATRVALDCAKYGDAAKVIEMLAQNLERESGLHRRVDLFFLVDSIAQCSKGLKSDAGGIYPSTILAVLPRLLSSAAPPGSSSLENRKQCLKVLRVWQERRILPESIIRHHIRELDALCGSSCSRTFSRRPLRNERAFDDPIREMEGMHVDEYGSNSSIQLPGFRMPPMLRDEDDGVDSDGESFEAVTPEHNVEKPYAEKNTLPVAEKHMHILEEVDGELEMEDIAPYSEAINSATGTDSLQNSYHPIGNPVEVPFAPPPLPKDVPPISPPLPKSPPPPPPPPPLPPLHAFSLPPERPDSFSNSFNPMKHTCSQKMEPSLQKSTKQKPIASGVKPTCDNFQYPPPCGDDFRPQMPKLPTSTNCSSFNGPPVSDQPVRTANNLPPADGSFNKGFRLRPPDPAPSNQFSYVQSDNRVQSQRDMPTPSHHNRFRVHNTENGNFYRDRDRVKLGPSDVRDRWRGPPPLPGPQYPDVAGMHHGRPPYGGHVREPVLPNHRWAFPPRSMNHREVMPHRHPAGGPIPVAGRGHNFWRPR